ncbi:hypothetical protein [Mesorhizobium sp. ORS 3428]|uniref:hypothetical protein n=1 Tax=Mesorhizobium sp. ORS 3428 TaxID=540997 RepID=UPI0010423F79|nr:hypothetical protein [Mesorhizobium sp. ORS 3428]
MDCFKKIEALIDAGSVNAVEEARTLLGQHKAASKAISEAVDEFLIDLMTLTFLIDAGREANSAQRLARMRLSKVRLLFPVVSEPTGAK